MKNLTVLILFFVSFACCGQDKELDSLYNTLAHYPEDSAKVKLIFKICKHELVAHRDTIPKLIEEALALSKKIGFVNGIGHSHTYMALYYRARGEYDKVADYALKMVEVFEKSANEDGLGQAYNMLGVAHFEMRNFDKAQYYQEKSLEVHSRSGQRYDMSRNYTNLGMIFSETKKHDEAIVSFSKALEVNLEFKNEEGIGRAYVNLAQAHINNRDFPSAINYYNSAFRIIRKRKDLVSLATTHLGLAEVYSQTGQYEKGIRHADSSLVLSKNLEDKVRLRDSYKVLADIEKHRNNFKAALYYREQSVAYGDSVFSEGKLKQIGDLEAKYETDKKEKEILLLEEKAKTQNLWRNSLIVGLFLTVVATVVIYRLQRSRTEKANQLLTVQETVNTKLVEVDKIKSRFFANISHEFRTPLTLIISPIEEKLLDSHIPQKEKISFQSIRRSANRLLELVNQLLELSKLESGFMKLQPQPGNLHHFIMPILSSFDSLADVGQVRYTKEVRSSEATVLFDGDKLEKILSNLLSNAFKFSPKGEKIEVKILAEDKGKSIELTMEIKNFGAIIPPDNLNKIFEPFFQGDNIPTRGVVGTGLGLSLVKELVKLHGGDIRATSSASEGTLFAVNLLFDKTEMPAFEKAFEIEETHFIAEMPEESNSAEITDTKETILIVEDNLDVRNLIRHGLEAHYNILEASTGKEGVAVAIEKSVDMVVSDVMMPVMSGMELCHVLKNDERTSHLPIILLTARADHESKLEGLRTGADDYVVKPFNMQELLARISNLIALRKKLIQKYNKQITVKPHEITVTPMDERFIQKVIQLVEDNLDNTEFTSDKMADGIGMSRASLHRKIKAITGHSTSEFIQDFRLRRAALFIEKKTDTVSQIAYQVGFNDHSYFTKCFKKKFGKTPSEWG